MGLYETHKNELTKQLIEQMEGVGFCVLKNVPGFDEEDLKKLSWLFIMTFLLNQKNACYLNILINKIKINIEDFLD